MASCLGDKHAPRQKGIPGGRTAANSILQFQHEMLDGRVTVHVDHVEAPVPVETHGRLALVAGST